MKKLGVGVLGVGEMGKRHAENLRQTGAGGAVGSDCRRSRRNARAWWPKELEIENWYSKFGGNAGAQGSGCGVDRYTGQISRESRGDGGAPAGKDDAVRKAAGIESCRCARGNRCGSQIGAAIAVGFMRRYDPAYAAAMKRIEAGEIGVPVIFKSLGRDKEWGPIAAYESRSSTECCFTPIRFTTSIWRAG